MNNKIYKVAQYIEINPDVIDIKNKEVINSWFGENINIKDSENLESIAFIFSKLWRNTNELIYSFKNISILIFTFGDDLIRPNSVNYVLYKYISKTRKKIEKNLNKEKIIETQTINLEELLDNLKDFKFKNVFEKFEKFIDGVCIEIKKSETLNFTGKIPGFLLLCILKLSIPFSNNIYYKNIKIK